MVSIYVVLFAVVWVMAGCHLAKCLLSERLPKAEYAARYFGIIATWPVVLFVKVMSH